MYSIHNRDDWEKLKKLQSSKSALKAERLKQSLGKQDFHYDMEKVFEPVTENQIKNINNQAELSEKQIQALQDSNEKHTQAIEKQTKAIQESSDIVNKNLHHSIQQGIKDYDEISKKNNQLLTNLVNSNQVDSSIVETISNLLTDKTKSQFSLEKINDDNPNLFYINPHNPQLVLIKGSNIIFENGNTYNLNDPDLSYFITNTHLDKEINKLHVIDQFLNDVKYDINYGDKKSDRYHFIKDLRRKPIDTYQQPYQVGSGLKFIFLPSDPNELVDQLKLIYLEKVGGNDNPQLNEQVIAIADKLLEDQCITTSEHQNIVSCL